MIEGTATTRFYLDFSGFHGLRATAREGSGAALEEVAAQFESLFVQFALKAMREATLGDGLLDSDQSRFYQGLLDQQLALSLTTGHRSLGLDRMITRQFAPHQESGAAAGEMPDDTSAMPVTRALKNPTVAAVNLYKAVQEVQDREPVLGTDAGASDATMDTHRSPPRPDMTPVISAQEIRQSREAFVRGLWPLAREAGRALGVSPRALLAQAALESGWGQSVMHRADGTNGHNLFGIKADRGWQGDRIVANTWEVVDGQRVPKQAAFRAYDSFAESFNDYVNFLQANPRYRQALRVAASPEAFVDALQRAGFATDPNYAHKIRAIMQSRIDEYKPDDSNGRFG